MQRHYADTFDSEEIVTGNGGDTAIDAIAILVNGALITDVETLVEQTENVGSVDVTFVFVQADRSSAFESAKIGNFGYGVGDFFNETPNLHRNSKITAAAAVMAAVYERSAKFKRGNPLCRLYYVTTGNWQGDSNLEARLKSVIRDLQDTGLFRNVTFEPVDATGLQQLYRQSKSAISREFKFANKTILPEMPGVKEAYLGFLPASDFLRIIQDEGGEIIDGLFYDNVRDWLDFNQVNHEIRATLESEARARFVLMNNGITIIARDLQPTGNKFLIEDFSVVNGCQTSHVLFAERDKIDESVTIPVRLIATQDENIINDIIKATNRQTEVREEQFYALQEFSKELENFFQAFDEDEKLYYERRTRQYHRLPIGKTRIVTPANMIKAFAAMFLAEPHRTTRNYAALKAKVGTEIFVKGQRMEPYYTAAYTLYKLEYYFRNYKLDAKYKPARFHILLAARILANLDEVPRFNSHEMERFCKKIMDILWDPPRVDELIGRATAVIDAAAGGNFDRDNIRTEPFTNKVSTEARRLASLQEGANTT